MLKRGVEFFVLDILISIDVITRQTITLKNVQRFISDELLYDAVLRNLEIIGEAMKHILASQKVTSLVKPKWRRIVDFRNFLSHEYFGISTQEILKIIEKKIPKLKDEMIELLKSLKNEKSLKIAFDSIKQELKNKGRQDSLSFLVDIEKLLV